MSKEGGGASRAEVARVGSDIVLAIGKKISRAGLVGFIVSLVIGIAGTVVELLLKADFGYVLIAMGILGTSIGITLWRTRKELAI